MAASLLGTTGNWGIPQDESGILILDISFNFTQQEKNVLDKGGEIIGLSLYQQVVEIKMSGLVARTNGFSAKIGTALTLANSMPQHLTTNTGGSTIIFDINRQLQSEDFEKIDVTAKHYPYVTTGS